jgi:membrane associated rhomboid family serine protease
MASVKAESFPLNSQFEIRNSQSRMFPFRDNIPSRTFPIITILIIIANVLAFFFELSVGPKMLDRFFMAFGVVPAFVFSWPASGEPFSALILPFVTSMFLHGGWLHLIGNMWYLWIFGDNVEDRVGHFRYLIFYFACGIGAGVVHTFLNPNSVVPSVGASGAIAGVLGAYLVSYPFARILTLVPILFFFQVIEVPALIVLGLWFVMQFFYGTATLASTTSAAAGGTAWWAHVGGFVIGIVLIGRLARKPRYDSYSRY